MDQPYSIKDVYLAAYILFRDPKTPWEYYQDGRDTVFCFPNEMRQYATEFKERDNPVCRYLEQFYQIKKVLPKR